ncbi:MAG: hypothetical protein OEX19_04225 [Gammaproteobacteria bacterium]|nr:hypothetical protein [Gammaproteobacteria bacterium]
MSTNNFNSSVDKSVKFDVDFMIKASSIGLSLVLSLSILVSASPAGFWYMPVVGVLLFAFSLVGLSMDSGRWRSVRKKCSVDRPVPAVLITEFGKQNSANDEFIKTAA